MENQDLIPHSEESQRSCSNKKAKLESDSIQAPSMGGQADEAKSTPKKSEIKCYKCKEYGHKCSACPNRKTRKQPPTPEPCLPVWASRALVSILLALVTLDLVFLRGAFSFVDLSSHAWCLNRV